MNLRAALSFLLICFLPASLFMSRAADTPPDALDSYTATLASHATAQTERTGTNTRSSDSFEASQAENGGGTTAPVSAAIPAAPSNTQKPESHTPQAGLLPRRPSPAARTFNNVSAAEVVMRISRDTHCNIIITAGALETVSGSFDPQAQDGWDAQLRIIFPAPDWFVTATGQAWTIHRASRQPSVISLRVISRN